MTQLYLDLFDVIPTEQKSVDDLGYAIDPEEAGHFHYMDWLEDIRANGVKHQLLVHPDGHIADGNFRYWCLEHLWKETGDWKWRMVPVNRWFYMGICWGIGDEKEGKHFSFRSDLMEQVPFSFQEKRPVIPSWPYLREWNQQDLGRGTHPFVMIRELETFQISLRCTKCGKTSLQCPKCKDRLYSRRTRKIKKTEEPVNDEDTKSTE